MTKRTEVVLFACIEKNIGDDLFIYTICKRYPDITFIISHAAKYGSIAQLGNVKFSRLLQFWLFFDVIEERNLLRKLVRRIMLFILQVFMGKHQIGVMIVGNAFKNYNYHGAEQIQWLAERQRLVTKFYLISTNFGPYNDARWVDDCAEVFQRLEDVCFRDQSSFSLFSNLPNVRIAPDAIFTFGNHVADFRDDKEKNIIISLIDCNYPGRASWLHKCTKPYENSMVSVINEAIINGYTITLLNANAAQDYEASKRVRDACNNPNKIQIINYEGHLDVVFELYQHASFIIATRLHAIILALLYGIPVLPIVYDSKVKGVLDSCCFSEPAVSIEESECISFDFIKNLFKKYSFELPVEIINRANDQFAELDKVL